MAWSVTMCLMIPPRNGAWTTKVVGTWNVGAVVDIFPFEGLLSDISARQTGYLHVHNIPDTISFDAYYAVFTKSFDEPGSEYQRRLWAFDIASLPGNFNQFRTRFVQNRQAEVDWAVVRPYVKNTVDGRVLSDADIAAII